MTQTDSHSLRGRTNFTESEVKEMFENAQEDNDSLDKLEPCQSGNEVVKRCLNERRTERQKAFIQALNGKSYDHPETGKRVLSTREALGKVVYEAEFYAPDNWEVVRNVAGATVYTDFEVRHPAATPSY